VIHANKRRAIFKKSHSFKGLKLDGSGIHSRMLQNAANRIVGVGGHIIEFRASVPVEPLVNYEQGYSRS
jgi:hypothetical protein